MHAAVYRGASVVSVEEIPTPAIGPGEILIRVEACGICHTDLKKIEYNLLAPPRVYGHETAGVVAAVGAASPNSSPATGWWPSITFPACKCFYCQRKIYAQCPVYKKVGITAGFEPAGGGFAQYVRVMDWIVERGVEKNPGRRFVRARHPGGTAEHLPEGGGAVRSAARRFRGGAGTGPDRPDVHHAGEPHRRARGRHRHDRGAPRDLAARCGAEFAWDPRDVDVAAEVKRLTEGRGADLVIVAASVPGIVEQAIACSRPGRAHPAFRPNFRHRANRSLRRGHLRG